jgi:hypothetical protein
MTGYDYSKYLETGKEVEAIFARSFAAHFGLPINAIVAATMREDIDRHFDLSYAGTKIDVKGLRKIYRQDANPDQEFHWIEFKNVGGKKGWLYGDADIFAFELNISFLCVRKSKLQELIHNKCAEKLTMISREPYTLYRRAGRNDILTIAKSLDLAQITDFIIEKIK